MAAPPPAPPWSIGARVRVRVPIPRGSGTGTGAPREARRRGVVATLQQDDAGDGAAAAAAAGVLLEAAPAPPRGGWLRGGAGGRGGLHGNRLVEDDAELTVAAAEVEGLLDFEARDDGEIDAAVPMATQKDRGDALLRCGDALAAIGYYEAALRGSSEIAVGGTVIVKQQGFTRLAEVDCYDGKGGPVDISMVHDGTELTIRPVDILICILEPDEERIQERVLLNLARCCLQSAELLSLQERSQFRRSAVFACTLVLDISKFHNDDDASDSAPSLTTITALILRSKAQKELARYDHARADLRRLLAMAPQHGQGQRLMQQLERDVQQTKRADKKLVKELCKWVDVAANQSVSEENERYGEPGVQQSMVRASPATRAAPQSASHPSYLPTGVPWIAILIVAVAAYYYRQSYNCNGA